jgi:hypothetical protein
MTGVSFLFFFYLFFLFFFDGWGGGLFNKFNNIRVKRKGNLFMSYYYKTIYKYEQVGTIFSFPEKKNTYTKKTKTKITLFTLEP